MKPRDRDPGHARDKSSGKHRPFSNLAISLAVLGSLSGSAMAQTRKAAIDVDIRWTSFGIPHVEAEDWSSLGYGLGYAYARDNLCILARAVVTARGDDARFFGDEENNLANSVVFKWLSRPENIRLFFDAQPREIQHAVQGYAAGFNRWLRANRATLPVACNGEPWVRPITYRDLVAVYLRGNARASLRPLASAVFQAQPPTEVKSATRSAAEPVLWPQQLDFPSLEDTVNLNDRFGGGSNAYGLGGRVTTNGRGMVLGNPHEPWSGIDRFYQAHLKIPGVLNVMGVTQFALPVIVIGFNRSLAWSHTVSSAKRFTLYELTLDPQDPLVYTVTDENGRTQRRAIEAIPVEVEVRGSRVPFRRTLYRSEYGLMVSANALNPLAPRWGDDLSALGGPTRVAYSIRDVNEENRRGIAQWLRMGQARGVRELRRVLSQTLGLPFVNTIAADRKGRAFYGDITVVPNVSAQKLAACAGSPIAQLFTASGVVTLDGARTACAWDTAPDTPQGGILNANALPSLITRDYVANSNDSYWLSNPHRRLTGFAPLLRRNVFDEASERSLRTRLGLIQIQDRLRNQDGLGGRRFTLKKLQTIWYSNRNHSAELALDAVLNACRSDAPPTNAWPTSRNTTVDVTLACEILSRWNRTDNLASVGVPIWRQLYRRVRTATARFAVPFDPRDPIHTPNTLIVDDAVRAALGDAVEELTALDIPLDTPLGHLQYVTRDKQPPTPNRSNVIPMHGGPGQNGVFNLVRTPLTRAGYTPVLVGPTYMQSVTWNDAGRVVAEAILGFAQTDDPENPLFADQTAFYSRKQFIRLPFREKEIRRDLKERVRLRERIILR